MKHVQVIEEVRINNESGEMFTSIAGVTNTLDKAKNAVEIMLKKAMENEGLTDGGLYYTGDRYAVNEHTTVIYKRRWSFVFTNMNDVRATLG